MQCKSKYSVERRKDSMNTIFLITIWLTIFGHVLSNSTEDAVSDGDISRYGIKDTINQLVESVRDAIPEVITVPSVDVELPENKYLTGYLNVSDVNLIGVKDFQAIFEYFFVIPKGFSLILDSLVLTLDYLIDVALFNIPLLSIFGNGTLSVTVTDLDIKGNIAFVLLPLNVSINSVQINIGAAKFDIKGLCNDETFSNKINDILNDNVGTFINENEKALSTTLENVINSFIAGMLSKSNTTESQNLMNNGYYTDEVIERILETVAEEFKTMVN